MNKRICANDPATAVDDCRIRQHYEKLITHRKSKTRQYQDKNNIKLLSYCLMFLDSYFDDNQFDFKSKICVKKHQEKLQTVVTFQA